ncbi:MAG TPA: toll/interleukin-1 receptor domain-containing protein [Pseudonocardiaceae bacterium]
MTTAVPAGEPFPGSRQRKTFICHADADKDSVAWPLARLLRERGVPVWLDVNELAIGVRLRSAIDAALAACDMAVVILSPAFYRSSWAADYEFDGLLSRHLRDRLPLFLVLHNITRDEVRARAPSLEFLGSRSTAECTVARIADEVAQVAGRRLRVGSPADEGHQARR